MIVVRSRVPEAVGPDSTNGSALKVPHWRSLR